MPYFVHKIVSALGQNQNLVNEVAAFRTSSSFANEDGWCVVKETGLQEGKDGGLLVKKAECPFCWTQIALQW